MVTIRQGANGGFSGKAGSIIGTRRDINYIKGLPRLSNTPKHKGSWSTRSPIQSGKRPRVHKKPAIIINYCGQINLIDI